ncbi:MAG TPA: hypothetical protein VFG20_12915 [Planctomycetaceae bacterium]|nr:hypothetical protein [Planctomycetaceae bacterium]
MDADSQRDDSSSTTEGALRASIHRLHAEGYLTDTEAAQWEAGLPETMRQSAYVVRHLTAHWSFGAIFAFDIIPLPLGTISRVCWTVSWRVIEMCRGRWDHATVHSLPVMAVAAIPVAGYLAYLIPLRSRSAEAVFLYANHFTYARYQCAWPVFLECRSKWIANILGTIVPTPEITAANPPNDPLPTGATTIADTSDEPAHRNDETKEEGPADQSR